MKKRFLIIALCLACVGAFAQTKGKKGGAKAPAKKPATQPVTKPDSTAIKQNAVQQPVVTTPPVTTPAKPFDRPVDGYFKKNDMMNAKVTPLTVLREADVVYQRRIWQEIDLRDKKNQYMASPKARFIDIIMDAVAKGELTAYDPTPSKDDPDGDAFGTPLTPEKAKLKMADSSVMNIIDKKTGEKTGSKMVAGEIDPDSVIKFRMKVDVIFDKQRSVEEYRIIGIAPMVKHQVEGVNNLDYQPAFWIYFPAARQILVTKEVVNSRNDATGLSYDDVFTKRMFSGYIVKQSNDQDLRIRDYAQGIDKLYESEKIKKSLMDWELNLWQY